MLQPSITAQLSITKEPLSLSTLDSGPLLTLALTLQTPRPITICTYRTIAALHDAITVRPARFALVELPGAEAAEGTGGTEPAELASGAEQSTPTTDASNPTGPKETAGTPIPLPNINISRPPLRRQHGTSDTRYFTPLTPLGAHLFRTRLVAHAHRNLPAGQTAMHRLVAGRTYRLAPLEAATTLPWWRFGAVEENLEGPEADWRERALGEAAGPEIVLRWVGMGEREGEEGEGEEGKEGVVFRVVE